MQLGFSDVDYSSGNFSKQMLTSHHFGNSHVPHYRQFNTTPGKNQRLFIVRKHFSKPRFSYLPLVWYPLEERQLYPTNHGQHRSLIACSGVSPLRHIFERCVQSFRLIANNMHQRDTCNDTILDSIIIIYQLTSMGSMWLLKSNLHVGLRFLVQV